MFVHPILEDTMSAVPSGPRPGRRSFRTIDRLLPLLQSYYLESHNHPEHVDREGYADLVRLLDRTVGQCTGSLPPQVVDNLRSIVRRNEAVLSDAA